MTERSEKPEKLPAWINEYIPRELVESTLFKFKIKLQTIDYYRCVNCEHKTERQLHQCPDCGKTVFRAVPRRLEVDMLPTLDLDYDLLENQMQDLPAQYAYWAAAYSEARLQVAIDERRMKAAKGRIIEKIQDEAKRKNIRLSVEQVKAVVEADDEIKKDDMRLATSQMQCGKLFHMMEALKMKAELGRSLAGFKRQELDRS